MWRLGHSAPLPWERCGGSSGGCWSASCWPSRRRRHRAPRAASTSRSTRPVDGPSNAQRLRVGWVRIFVGWSIGEPARGDYDRRYLDSLARDVAAYRARGVKTLLAVQSTPGWAAGPLGAGAAAPADPNAYGRFLGELRPLDARRGGDRGLERARLGDLLARRAGPRGLRGAPARGLRAGQGRRSARDRRDGRHGGQPPRVPGRPLRQRRRRRVRRRRRAHRHRVPAHLPRRVLPRARRPRRALLVHGLPRGARRHDRQRRRGQGRVDDRDRLEHRLAQAALVPGRRRRRHPRGGREREHAGAVPDAGLSLRGRRPSGPRRAVVLAPGRRPRAATAITSG